MKVIIQKLISLVLVVGQCLIYAPRAEASASASISEKHARFMEILQSVASQDPTWSDLEALRRQGVALQKEMQAQGIPTQEFESGVLIPLQAVTNTCLNLAQCDLNGIARTYAKEAAAEFQFPSDCEQHNSQNTGTLTNLAQSLTQISEKFQEQHGSEETSLEKLTTLRDQVARTTEDELIKGYMAVQSQFIADVPNDRSLDTIVKEALKEKNLSFDDEHRHVPMNTPLENDLKIILAQAPKNNSERPELRKRAQERMTQYYQNIAHHHQHKDYYDYLGERLASVSKGQNWSTASSQYIQDKIKQDPDLQALARSIASEQFPKKWDEGDLSGLKVISSYSSNAPIPQPSVTHVQKPKEVSTSEEASSATTSFRNPEEVLWKYHLKKKTNVEETVPEELGVLKTYIESQGIEVAWNHNAQNQIHTALGQRPKSHPMKVSGVGTDDFKVAEVRAEATIALSAFLEDFFPDPEVRLKKSQAFMDQLDESIAQKQEELTQKGSSGTPWTEEEFRRILETSVSSLKMAPHPEVPATSLENHIREQQNHYRKQKHIEQYGLVHDHTIALTPTLKDKLRRGDPNGLTQEEFNQTLNEFQNHSLQFLSRIPELYAGEDREDLLEQLGRAMKETPSILAKILLKDPSLAPLLCTLYQESKIWEDDEDRRDNKWILGAVVLTELSILVTGGLTLVSPPVGLTVGAALIAPNVAVDVITTANLWEDYAQSKDDADLSEMGEIRFGEKNNRLDLEIEAKEKLAAAMIATGLTTVGAVSGFKALRGFTKSELFQIAKAKTNDAVKNAYARASRRLTVKSDPAGTQHSVIDRINQSVRDLKNPDEWGSFLKSIYINPDTPADLLYELERALLKAKEGNYAPLAYLRSVHADRAPLAPAIASNGDGTPSVSAHGLEDTDFRAHSTSVIQPSEANASPSASLPNTPSALDPNATAVGGNRIDWVNDRLTPSVNGNGHVGQPLKGAADKFPRTETHQRITIDTKSPPPPWYQQPPTRETLEFDRVGDVVGAKLGEGSNATAYVLKGHPDSVIKVYSSGASMGVADTERTYRRLQDLGLGRVLPRTQFDNAARPIYIVQERMVPADTFHALTGQSPPAWAQTQIEQAADIARRHGIDLEIKPGNWGFDRFGNPRLMDIDDTTIYLGRWAKHYTGHLPAAAPQALRPTQTLSVHDLISFTDETGQTRHLGKVVSTPEQPLSLRGPYAEYLNTHVIIKFPNDGGFSVISHEFSHSISRHPSFTIHHPTIHADGSRTLRSPAR